MAYSARTECSSTLNSPIFDLSTLSLLPLTSRFWLLTSRQRHLVMGTSNVGKNWDTRQHHELLRLAKFYKNNWQTIAAELKRSEGGVKSRWEKLNSEW